MERLTHGNPHEVIRPSDLNFWLAQYNRNHPNLADDCQELCAALKVNWVNLFIFAVSRSRWFSETNQDLFKTGCSDPDIRVQIREAATVWNSVNDMGELKNLTPEELAKFDKILNLWKLRESFLIERRTTVAPDVKVDPIVLPPPKPVKTQVEPVDPPKSPSSWKVGLPKIPRLLTPFISFLLGFLVGFLDKLLDKFVGPNDYEKWLRPMLDWILALFSN